MFEEQEGDQWSKVVWGAWRGVYELRVERKKLASSNGSLGITKDDDGLDQGRACREWRAVMNLGGRNYGLVNKWDMRV